MVYEKRFKSDSGIAVNVGMANETGTLRIRKKAFTFDDVMLVPALSTVLPQEVCLKTKLCKGVSLNIPILSASMDTVTESKFAIALAQEGGIGFIHKNMSIAEQAEQVRRVKQFKAGVVSDPVTVTPDFTVEQIRDLAKNEGFHGFPVVDAGGILVGIITRRDIRFVTDDSTLVSTVMTTQEHLATLHTGASKSEVQAVMHKFRTDKVLVVSGDAPALKLEGLITAKDFQKAEDKPNSCVDSEGRLRVGAAVGAQDGNEQRVKALVEAGADVILIDSSHGHSEGVLNRIRVTREAYPDLPIIGGNVATGEGALALIEAGASAVKVGIGPGSICTTRIVTGVGVPQVTAISDAVEACKPYGIPVIADGGIKYSGDMCKALAAGASCIMAGSLFAGTEESPGEVVLFQGRTYKTYRGMGSLGAMSKGSKDRYFQSTNAADKLVPEGIEGRVPYKGSCKHIVHQMMGGLRSCMGLTGCADVETLRTKPEFVIITGSGLKESHVHDVQITKETPNYH